MTKYLRLQQLWEKINKEIFEIRYTFSSTDVVSDKTEQLAHDHHHVNRNWFLNWESHFDQWLASKRLESKKTNTQDCIENIKISNTIFMNKKGQGNHASHRDNHKDLQDGVIIFQGTSSKIPSCNKTTNNTRTNKNDTHKALLSLGFDWLER